MTAYLFNFHNIAWFIAIASGIIQPYISAWLTAAPGWLCGVLTSLQAAAAGLIAELVAAPAGYNWRLAIGTAFSSWIVAELTQLSHLTSTKWARRNLHNHGPQLGHPDDDTLPRAA